MIGAHVIKKKIALVVEIFVGSTFANNVTCDMIKIFINTFSIKSYTQLLNACENWSSHDKYKIEF